jgi:tripartite-type tricarboxylate transporter receptor subunit TctC
MRSLKTFVVAFAIVWFCAEAAAQSYPTKPIRMVVPYSAGGGADNAARVVAQELSKSLGQQIIIDNRPGAGGVIGEEQVAKTAPDGYTVLFDASGFAINPALRKLPFDPKAIPEKLHSPQRDPEAGSIWWPSCSKTSPKSIWCMFLTKVARLH